MGWARSSMPIPRRVGNNGSAFGGFGAATPWQTTALGLLMLLGRYAIIVPMLAIAGSLAAKKRAAVTSGTFPTHGPLFVTLLILTVAILGAADLLPGAGTWPDRRTDRPGRRAKLLIPRGPEAHAFPLQFRDTPYSISSTAHPGLYTAALRAAFAKLHPRALMGNAVIFVTAVTAGLTSVLALRDLAIGAPGWGVTLQVAFWLWVCVLFANFAEALAEGRGKAPRRQPARDQGRNHGPAARPRGRPRAEIGAVLGAAGRAACARRGRRPDPDRRRGDPRRRLGRQRSPAKARPSSADPAATAARSPAAPGSSPTA